MSFLISRTETDQAVTFVLRADLETTTCQVTVYKSDPPSWKITPSVEQQAGRSWRDIVADFDAHLTQA